jgi:hypothetical protein
MQVPKILGERQRDGMRGRTKFMGRKTVRRLLQHGFGVSRSNTNKTSRTGDCLKVSRMKRAAV